MWFTIIRTISVVLSVVIVYYLKEKAHRCQLIGYEIIIIIIIISDDSSMFLFIMPLSSIIVKSSNVDTKNLFFAHWAFLCSLIPCGGSPVFRLSPSFFQTFSRVNLFVLLHTGYWWQHWKWASNMHFSIERKCACQSVRFDLEKLILKNAIKAHKWWRNNVECLKKKYMPVSGQSTSDNRVRSLRFGAVDFCTFLFDILHAVDKEI